MVERLCSRVIVDEKWLEIFVDSDFVLTMKERLKGTKIKVTLLEKGKHAIFLSLPALPQGKDLSNFIEDAKKRSSVEEDEEGDEN